VSLNKFLTWV